MTHKLNSPAARAKLKAYIEADKPKKPKTPKEIVHVITTKADFAGWCSQHPGPAKLFGMIVRRWTGSTAFAPGRMGKWAAYTHEEWCKLVGISVATLKRYLDRIEEAGLIEREVHRHGGKATKSFLRPTPLGLSVINAKPEDWERLGLSVPAPASDQVRELGALFRELYELSTGKFPPKLTAGQRKQLKEFADGCPDGLDPQDVLANAVAKWDDFTTDAAVAAGLLTVPEVPRIEFLRTHMHVAIDFFGYVPGPENDASAGKSG